VPEEETGIYRGEVLALIGALADIRWDVVQIRKLLEDEDGSEEEEAES
jgi:hypothetical protein